MALKDYRKLRQILEESENWPLLYMFKFIVPNQHGKVDKVVSLLPEEGEISFNHTKSMRHVAVTCKVEMSSSDEIISVTENVTTIEGVMAL